MSSETRDLVIRALQSAYAHGEKHAPFALHDCARQIVDAALLARTEAGADSAVAYQHREAGTEKWYDCSKEYYNTLKRHPWDRATMRRQELRALYTHPQDASGDAEVLRAALADIHAFAHRESSGPVVEDDLWTIRNMAAAAMQAKEAK